MKFQSIALITSGLVAAGPLSAGPLTPPAGPVQSTYKTLLEIEPRTAINAVNTPGDDNSMYRITTPGSYYLTEQLTVFPNKRGLEIAADNVTIDLNGFRIGGYPGSMTAIVGDGDSRQNITIHNGLIGPMDGAAIDLVGPAIGTGRIRVHDLTVTDCKLSGVRVARTAMIERVLVADCGWTGIEVNVNGRVVDCVVRSCETGIAIGTGGIVERCIATGNEFHGITMGMQSVARENSCCNNGIGSDTGAGIAVSTGSQTRLEDNHCGNNDRGIWTQSNGALVIRNTCSGNGVAWVLAPGTQYGPIIDRVNAQSPAVNGSSAPEALGSAHPHANFTY